MRSRILAVIAAGLLVAGCRNNQQVKRGEQNYDVVQEGATDTVTSTISGPGETPPPSSAVPLTGTNADTTTAFSLPATTSGMPNGSMQQSPTIAGTMPPTPPVQTTTRPRVIRTPQKTVITNTDASTNTNTSTVATDTVAVAPPTQTDTAQTDQTQTPPPPPTDTTQTTTSKPPQ